MACIHADKLVSLKGRSIFVCFGPGEKEEDLDVKPSCSAGLDRRVTSRKASRWSVETRCRGDAA